MSYREGWKDRVEGRPFTRSYERWTYKSQLAYENGRRDAAIVEHEGTIRMTKRPNFNALPAVVCVVLSDEKRF